jgi:hypothetical protein
LFYVGERPRYGLDVSGSCFSAHFWPGHKKLRLETGVYFVMIRSCIPDPVNSGKEHARVCFVIKVARGAGSRPDEARQASGVMAKLVWEVTPKWTALG